MTPEIWFAYCATLLIFMVTPGPSHLLMLSNSMTHGFRPSLATAAGDLSANSLQILAAGLGLASLVLASQEAFAVVKWAGVAYLVYLGVQKIRTAGRMDPAGAAGPGRQSLFLQGFLTSAVNPKAVVFFAGLFPLFLDPTAPLAPQILILGATYIAFDGAFLCFYGATASWLSKRLQVRAKAWLDRASGGFLIVAAVLLSLKQATPR